MSKILFTGGGGFLGSAVCKKLAELNNEVVVFDNYSRMSHINSSSKLYEIYVGDVRDINDFNKCIEKYRNFDSLWHFAYINGTSSFYTNPSLVLDVGVRGAINTLDTALKNNIKNYILASTSEVYNEPTTVPTPETERILIPDVHNPRFSYSGGKIISELLSIHYGAQQGLNTKIVRPHNVYGPNMGLEHVIPQLIKKILVPTHLEYDDDKLIVNIQGDGSETRAFCFIDDAVDEIILASNAYSNEMAPIYNIGVEKETSILELTEIIADILNIKIQIRSGEKSAGSSNRRCPSMSKMNALGYKPNHTLLSGLEKTIDWYKDYYLGKAQ